MKVNIIQYLNLNIFVSFRYLGLPYSRMMLAGFSQGGAMSLFTGLQLPAEEGVAPALAGLVVMSGYLPGKH